MQLRPYQEAAVAAVADWRRDRPADRGVLVLPTGSGKTPVIARLTADEIAAGRRVVQLVHRKELLQQNIATTMRMVPDVGIYAANLGRKDRTRAVTVASVQSLRRDPYAIGPVDLVLIDECHLVPLEEDTAFRKVLAGFRALRGESLAVVGLTATPYRLGSGILWEGDDPFFAGAIFEARIPDLLTDGYLCPVRPRAGRVAFDLKGVATRGDFVASELNARVDIDEKTKGVVAECVDAFRDRRHWLLFAVSVAHAEHLADALTAAGIPAAAVHGGLSDRERADRLTAFKAGTLRAAVSCELLTTGFDFPAIDAIAMVRPTKSAALYYQMVGRGFRVAATKADCLVLDFAGNVVRHGPVDTLADRITGRTTDGEGVAPAKECECGAILATAVRVCPECGHTFPEPDRLREVTTRPTARPILSTDVALPTWHEVDAVTTAIHTSRMKGTTTLRVEYRHGYRVMGTEYVCFEHTGYAREKAERWWTSRSLPAPIPTTCDEAWHRLADTASITPEAIATQLDGDFERIVAIRWPRPGQELPRACWTCAHLSGSGVCGLAGVEPPAEVEPVGCECWALMADADEFARTMGSMQEAA